MNIAAYEKRYWYGLNRYINPKGFGCWQLIGEFSKNNKPHGWSNLSKNKALKLVHEAINQGIELFDTAPGYGNGKSEEILGNALSSSLYSEKSVICSKVSITVDEVYKMELGDRVVEVVEGSLKRLKREKIDILLLHNPPDNIDFANLNIKVLEHLQSSGKIGTFGISSRSISGALNAMESNFGTCVEWVFHILERRPIELLFPKLKDYQINFIARSPLSRGLLSTSRLKNNDFSFQNEFRSTLDKEWIDWTVSAIQNLDLTEEEIENISNLSLRFCLEHEEVSAIIPGINSMKYLRSYVEMYKSDLFYLNFINKIKIKTPAFYPYWA